MEQTMFGLLGHGGSLSSRRDPFFDDADDFFGRGFSRPGFGRRDPLDELFNRFARFEQGPSHYTSSGDPRFETKDWNFDSASGDHYHQDRGIPDFSKLQSMQDDEIDRFSRRGRHQFSRKPPSQSTHYQSSNYNTNNFGQANPGGQGH